MGRYSYNATGVARFRPFRRLAACALAAVTLILAPALPSPALAETGSNKIRPELKTPPRGTRVNVTANQLVYDFGRKIAIATGDVFITYGKYVLVARKVVYDQRRDVLRADGEVRLREPGGNILEADIAQLQNKFRDGFAEHLRLLLTNDATLTADYAKRTDGTLTIYTRVAYTRCKTCVFASGEPLWQLKSDEATHDEVEGVIYHRNAKMEFAGLPIFWTPWLSHPDPNNKRHSGFLIPGFSYSNRLGAGVDIPYFWDLAPNYDITFRPRILTQQGVLARAEWRHRTHTGRYYVDGGGIYQLQPGKLNPPGDKHLRGFVRTEGDFRINDHWTWGWDATAVSDDTFLRRYRLDNRTDIASYNHITGIRDQNYFTARAYHFRGLLTTDDSDTFPFMAPYIRHNYVFDQPVLGGQLGFNTSIYSIHREKSVTPFTTVNHGTDQTRMTNELTWEREFINSSGQMITPFMRLRSDVAVTNNVPDVTAPGGIRDHEVTARVNPTIGVDMRWPFLRSSETSRQILTPVFQLVSSTNEKKENRIGNEDAITLNFDHSSLFLHDRFTGYDRFEGGTRANYGLLYSILFDNGGFLRFSLGQSVHLAGNNSYTATSGLDGDFSDFVTAVAFQPVENFRLTYQARFDENSFDVLSHEAGVSFEVDRLTAAVNFTDLDAAPAYGRPSKQRQIWGNADLELGAGWNLFGQIRYDLERSDPIMHLIGIGWDCDCFNVRLYYKEDFTRDGDVEKEQAVFLSVEFKTLGSARIGSGI
jgi:LPS-assembly protein